MKLPNNIATLTELGSWCDKNNPDVIEIEEKAEIRTIQEFNPESPSFWGNWKYFRQYPIKYLKKFL